MLGPSTSSGTISASAVVSAYPCMLHSLVINGGADASTITIYDNATAASGTVLAKISCAIGAFQTFTTNCGIIANNGLYASITGTTPAVIVHYERS